MLGFIVKVLVLGTLSVGAIGLVGQEIYAHTKKDEKKIREDERSKERSKAEAKARKVAATSNSREALLLSQILILQSEAKKKEDVIAALSEERTLMRQQIRNTMALAQGRSRNLRG